MISITLDALVTHVETALYQAAGPSTQLYSQDLIVQKITDAYITLANDPDVRWKRYRLFNKYTLDGTTGRTTVAISDLFKAFGDIYSIFVDQSRRPLTYLGVHDNPYLITGSRPIKYIRDTVDTIRILPSGATGDIVIVGKSIPQPPFSLDDIMTFDYLCISHYVCWQYAVDDGANPAMAEKFRQLFESRYKAIKDEEATEAILLSGDGNDIPTTWWSNP